MSAIGYRQRGQDGPLYNPERDFAYITPTLMARAVANMECSYDSSAEVREWCDANSLTKQDMAKIAEALARAQRDFVNAADPVSTFEQALARRDFFLFPHALRQFLFANIGEVLCGAWFAAVREVSVVGEESPAQGNMARFTAVVSDFAGRQGCDVAADINATLATAAYYNDVLQTRLNILYKELQAANEKLAALETTTAPATEVPPAHMFDFAQAGGMFGWLTRTLRGLFTGAKPRQCQSTGCTKTRSSSGRS